MYSLKLLNRQGSKLYKANAKDVPKPRIKLERDGEIEYIALEERENEGAEVGFVVGEKWVYPVRQPIMDGLICWLDGRDGSNEEQTSVWVDRSGNGNDATLYNFGFTSTSGWTGEGLRADGSNDYCRFSQRVIPIGTEQFTICATFKLDSAISTYPYSMTLFSFSHDETKGISFEKGWDASTTSNFYVLTGCSNNTSNSQPFVAVNTGVNTVCITSNWTEKKSVGYVDGEQKVMSAPKTAYTDTGGFYNLFRFRDSGTVRSWNGELLSFRVYNRALTEEEIKWNYHYERRLNITTNMSKANKRSILSL